MALLEQKQSRLQKQMPIHKHLPPERLVLSQEERLTQAGMTPLVPQLLVRPQVERPRLAMSPAHPRAQVRPPPHPLHGAGVRCVAEAGHR